MAQLAYRLLCARDPSRECQRARGSSQLFQNALFILRAAVAIQFLPFVRDLQSVKFILVLPERERWIGWIALCYMLLQLASWLVAVNTNNGRRCLCIHYIQAWADFLLGIAVIWAKRDAATSAVALFLLPLMSISHLGSERLWLAQVVAMLGGVAIAIFFVGTPEPRSVVALVVTRVMGLLTGSVVLRLYRGSQLLERSHLQSLKDGTLCGVTLLNLDGSIREWNQVQEKQFAAPESREAMESGKPCYWVFHRQPEPCKWCALDWHSSGHGDTVKRKLAADNPHIAQLEIDVESLRHKIEKRINWTISNQLVAGEDARERFHIYHICYGLYSEDDIVTGVVEAVTDVTETVLEMPFLFARSASNASSSSRLPPVLSTGDENDVTEGLPPISVVKAEDCTVLEMNRAKLKRSQHGRQQRISKENLLNLHCTVAYNRPKDMPECKECAVKSAIAGKWPARSITDYPGRSLVTAVPVAGPDGQIRALFEFIDPIDDLSAIEESGRAFGELVNNKRRLFAEARKKMRDLAEADRCVILELDEREAKIHVWSDEGEAKTIAADRVTIAEDVRTQSYIKVADLSTEERLGRTLKLAVSKRGLGPGALLRIAARTGDLLAIAVLERKQERPQFDDEKIVYCTLLANHFAVSVARNRDFQKREQFIRVMETTADILDSEAALQKLLERSVVFMPRDVFLVGYVLKDRGSNRELHSVEASQFLGIGGSSTVVTRQIVPVTPELQTFLDSPTSTAAPATCPSVGQLVQRQDTKHLRSYPLIYHGHRSIGYIVAESREHDAGKAFLPEVADFLELISRYAAILCGRAELLRACRRTYEHDLNVPLQAACDALDLYLEAKPNVDLSRIRDELTWQCENLSAAKKAWDVKIGQSLAIPRTAIDLFELANRVDTFFKRKFPYRELSVEVDRQEAILRCDPVCLEVAIREQLTNAGKFGDPGIVAIRFYSDADNIRVSVENEGLLPADAESRAFELYWRASDHESQGIPGTGLGLWELDTLIRAHNGTVRLSQIGPNTIANIIQIPLSSKTESD